MVECQWVTQEGECLTFKLNSTEDKNIFFPCNSVQVENQAISLELVSMMTSATNIHDVALVFDENSTEKGTLGRFFYHLKSKVVLIIKT